MILQHYRLFFSLSHSGRRDRLGCDVLAFPFSRQVSQLTLSHVHMFAISDVNNQWFQDVILVLETGRAVTTLLAQIEVKQGVSPSNPKSTLVGSEHPKSEENVVGLLIEVLACTAMTPALTNASRDQHTVRKGSRRHIV
jgi:hypothetical protein